MAMPVPFSGSASSWARTGTSTPNSGVVTVGAEQRLVALVVGVGDEGDARRDQLGPGGLDLVTAVGLVEPEAVVGAGHLAVLELGLGDRRAEVDVPQRGRLDPVHLAAGQVAEKGELRHAGDVGADGAVEVRPVDRQADGGPKPPVLLLQLDGEGRAQLDEVGAGDGDRLLRRRVGGPEVGVVGERRVADDAVVELRAALDVEAVVVPAHRVEDLLAPHALVAGDGVGVGVGAHVADVQAAADGGRRRVDRVDLGRVLVRSKR